jgi:hypothetical protein
MVYSPVCCTSFGITFVGQVYLWFVNGEQIIQSLLQKLFFGIRHVDKNCYSENYSFMKYNFTHDFARLVSNDKDSLKCLSKVFKNCLRLTWVI